MTESINILKWVLPRGPGVYPIDLPVDAEVIAVQNQNERLVFWTKSTSRKTRLEKLAVMETGANLNLDSEYLSGSDRLRHLGTVQFQAGSYVLHIFRVQP